VGLEVVRTLIQRGRPSAMRGGRCEMPNSLVYNRRFGRVASRGRCDLGLIPFSALTTTLQGRGIKHNNNVVDDDSHAYL